LHFIQRAKIEHKKYLSEKKKRLTAVLASLLSIATTAGIVGNKYVNDERQKTVEIGIRYL